MIFNSRNAINTLICESTVLRRERKISVSGAALFAIYTFQIGTKQLKKIDRGNTLAFSTHYDLECSTA